MRSLVLLAGSVLLVCVLAGCHSCHSSSPSPVGVGSGWFNQPSVETERSR
jgi:hypothetical protein